MFAQWRYYLDNKTDNTHNLDSQTRERKDINGIINTQTELDTKTLVT